jgi:hypothetical protein
MTRGRRPKGPKLVDGLDGSAEAKRRLEVILESISGQRTVAEARALLGLSEARFHELRNKIMQAALERSEPQPVGRPRHEPAPQQAQLAALEAQIRDLRIDLHAAQVREEIALVMPHLLKPSSQQQAAVDEVADNAALKKTSLVNEQRPQRRGE